MGDRNGLALLKQAPLSPSIGSSSGLDTPGRETPVTTSL